MATVHADEPEEVEAVQNDTPRVKVSKKHIAFGVLAVAVTAAVIYSIINKENKK